MWGVWFFGIFQDEPNCYKLMKLDFFFQKFPIRGRHTLIDMEKFQIHLFCPNRHTPHFLPLGVTSKKYIYHKSGVKKFQNNNEKVVSKNN